MKIPEDLMEELAEIEHERWSSVAIVALTDMTDERRTRWGRLAKTPYKHLSEEMKERDREQVRKASGPIIERIATLTEQLEQANRHLNWLPPDQSFICSGCGVVYLNPHATDCPEVQQ